MQETRTFVRLRLLQDVTYEGETAEQREAWLDNVLTSVGETGYCLDDGEGDEYITKELTADEIEFASVDCYFFMGSEYEQERFYALDFITVREKATGDLYAYETEQIKEGAF
jgi:uroporphyrinogen-III synthase